MMAREETRSPVSVQCSLSLNHLKMDGPDLYLLSHIIISNCAHILSSKELWLEYMKLLGHFTITPSRATCKVLVRQSLLLHQFKISFGSSYRTPAKLNTYLSFFPQRKSSSSCFTDCTI